MLRYQLAEDVKVRDEEFGLLFYLCSSTNLVLIASNGLLKAAALRQGGTAAELSWGLSAAQSATVEKLLDKLVQRGLLHAQG